MQIIIVKRNRVLGAQRIKIVHCRYFRERKYIAFGVEFRGTIRPDPSFAILGPPLNFLDERWHFLMFMLPLNYLN